MEIKILSRNKAKSFSFLDDAKDFVFISITDIGSAPLRINRANVGGFFGFQFNDEDEDVDGAPQLEDIDRLISVFERTKGKEKFVVHCEAGICRSSATAIALFCHRNGCDFEVVVNQFKEDLGWVMPNTRMAALLDQRMNMNGELISICDFFNKKGLDWRIGF